MVILFLLSLSGYIYICHKKIQLEKEYIPIFVLSIIALIVFLGGLLGQLLLSACLVMVIGLILSSVLIKDILKKESDSRIIIFIINMFNYRNYCFSYLVTFFKMGSF